MLHLKSSPWHVTKPKHQSTWPWTRDGHSQPISTHQHQQIVDKLAPKGLQVPTISTMISTYGSLNFPPMCMCQNNGFDQEGLMQKSCNTKFNFWKFVETLNFKMFFDVSIKFWKYIFANLWEHKNWKCILVFPLNFKTAFSGTTKMQNIGGNSARFFPIEFRV